jgi:hypothetical protein
MAIKGMQEPSDSGRLGNSDTIMPMEIQQDLVELPEEHAGLRPQQAY